MPRRGRKQPRRIPHPTWPRRESPAERDTATADRRWPRETLAARPPWARGDEAPPPPIRSGQIESTTLAVRTIARLCLVSAGGNNAWLSRDPAVFVQPFRLTM